MIADDWGRDRFSARQSIDVGVRSADRVVVVVPVIVHHDVVDVAVAVACLFWVVAFSCFSFTGCLFFGFAAIDIFSSLVGQLS